LKYDADIRLKNLKVIKILKSILRYECSNNLKCFHLETKIKEYKLEQRVLESDLQITHIHSELLS